MTRPAATEVTRVTCVGAGTIGAGWAAYFLSRGLEVVATDPGADAEERMRKNIEGAWPKLETLGLAEGASLDRLKFTSDLATAVAEAEFIQESAPDYEDLKIELFESIGKSSPADTVISSSSSKFLPTQLASRCANPERCVVGHPFVPSYLVPLVEVVGGERTSDEVMIWATDFYTAVGKKALRLKKEIHAYLANRLQHVVFEEAAQLVADGVCDFEDVDTAMSYGPGMRWAFAGPMLCYHMGGGKGGIRHMLDHFGWSGPEGQDKTLIEAVDNRVGDTSMEELEQWRDDNLLAMLKHLKSMP
jgi:carnitine 3-dehydrogenase